MAVAPKKRVLGGFMKKLTAAADDQKKYLRLTLGPDRVIEVGDPAIDWAMGGYKRGESNLFFGPSKSGKSTLALKIAGIEQKKKGGLVLIFDSEYAHNTSLDEASVHARWRAAGLDPDNTVAISSNLVNELFANLGDLEADLVASRDWYLAGAVEKDKPKNFLNIAAILVDSWGGIESETAKEKLNDGNISGAANAFGGNAKTINPIIQTILRLSATYGITSLHVQHCIENMDKDPRTGAYRGPKWILLGGQKLRYLSQSITFLESVESADSFINENGDPIKTHGGVPTGKKIRVRCEKSRKQVEGRKSETWVNFEDCTFARSGLVLFNLASGLKIVGHPMIQDKDAKGKPKVDSSGNPVMKQAGNAWWAFMERQEQKWNGQEAFIAELNSNPALFSDVLNACKNASTTDAIGAKLGSEEGVGSGAGDEDEDENSLAIAAATLAEAAGAEA